LAPQGVLMPRIELETKKPDLRDRLKACELLPEVDLKKPLSFIDSGSWMLNLALTNHVDQGYPIARVINPVGDYSTGKTLLACEVVNSVWYLEHLLKKKKVKIYYDEPEHAFDYRLAAKFNVPLHEIIGLREDLKNYKPKKPKKGEKAERQFKRSHTVEDLYNNLDYINKNDKDYDVVLYIIDSLDTLTDSREIKHLQKKGIEKQDMGGSKARVLSQLFRNSIDKVHNSNILLFILSQIRMNVGVVFGDPNTRAGGKALDHYSSQIFMLKEIGKIQSDKKINQGIEVRVKIKKNKTGSRYNDVVINILHGYGIDNFGSAVNFLWDNSQFERSGNYLVFHDKKMYRSELIELAANDPVVAQELKCDLQDYWNEMILEAEITRKPKWGG
jgi:recombination protein RecA